MGIVVILDQQRSATSPDRVSVATGELARLLESGLVRVPERTTGDELQAVIGDPYRLPVAVEFCLRAGGWWLGIGLGEIESLGPTSRESRGPAFSEARRAIERAKRRRRRPVAVCGDPPELTERMEGMCHVLAFLTERRTERQWEVIDAVRRLGTGSRAARSLRISPQSSNNVLRRAGFHEQEATQAEIGHLAAEANRRWEEVDAR